MKPIILICICLFTLSSINAQEKNHISIDPFLPVFGTIQVQYERAINNNNNMSLGISIGYKTSSGIFRVEGINRNRITTDDFNFKGIKIIPEFRWYFQKPNNGLSGLYAGAYLKYQNYKDKILGIYTDSNLMDHNIEIDTKIKTSVAGVQIGYKFIVKKRFFIDFIIAGPGVGFNKFELDEKKSLPDEFYDDLSNAISNYGVFEHLNTDIKIDVNKKSETVVLPAFRYGIKLGFTF